MTPMTRDQVLAAIDTLETSYSYERPRWLGAYVALREIERAFHDQMKPYFWIAHLFAYLGLASWLAIIIWGFTHIGAEPLFSGTWFDSLLTPVGLVAPAALIWFGGWLCLRLAARRHPSLLLKARVEDALDRFRNLAGDPAPERYV